MLAMGAYRAPGDTVTHVAERVAPYDLKLAEPLRWDPNAPDAFLVSDDMGRSALAQRAHPADPDRRCVVLRWDVAHYALMTPPNDEARQQHRLYEKGLKDLDLIVIVRESSLVEALRPMWHSVGGFVPQHKKDNTKECV